MPKPGKYDHVIDDLPRLPTTYESEGHKNKVELEKTRIVTGQTHTAESLTREYMKLRAEKDRIEEELSGVQVKIDAYVELLVESHDADETGWGQYGASPNTLKLADGSSVAVRQEPAAKVEDPERFRLWCVANGYEHSMRLHPKTTEAIARLAVLENRPAPDGLKVYSRPKIVYTRARVEE